MERRSNHLAFQRWKIRWWLGMGWPAWSRLLAANHFAVSPSRAHWAAAISIAAARNSLYHTLQEQRWRRRIDGTHIAHAPIFIIGHWRAGTTLLHELLTLDARHTYPTTYACIFPGHFLLTEGWFPRWFPFLLPPERPVDRMRMGWARPQEDEFALCNLGQPSPYLKIAFPNGGREYDAYFDLERLPPDALRSWKRCFIHFLTRLTARDPRRIVLKSPTHTYRLRVLLELFPDARFVHIVRNPYVVFPSTMRLWRALYTFQGLQRPTFDGLEEYVFRNFSRMYARLEDTRPLVPRSRFCEVRYEDVVADPIGQLREIYRQLDLGDFEAVLPALGRHAAEMAAHTPNRYDLQPSTIGAITGRWEHVIRQYGYSYLA